MCRSAECGCAGFAIWRPCAGCTHALHRRADPGREHARRALAAKRPAIATANVGVDDRPDGSDRRALGRVRSAQRASPCKRPGRDATRCALRWNARSLLAHEGDARHPNCLRAGDRSRASRIRHKPWETGRQRHRVCEFRLSDRPRPTPPSEGDRSARSPPDGALRYGLSRAARTPERSSNTSRSLRPGACGPGRNGRSPLGASARGFQPRTRRRSA